uniref:Uncharacterized protein n=1 Tax=Panagrolaimus davidi TaxID=227884 RepID=A0A914Q519_9BILA
MSLVSVHSYNKSNNNEYCGTAATYFIVSHNYEDKEKLQLWNKSSASTFRNINEDNDDFKKQWKNENILNITNKSTFSLHIAAYENSIEAVALDLTDNENIEEYKKEKFGSIKTSKQCFTDSLKFRNPFEFPRQQNVNQRNEPEVMRFSASQRLLGSQRPTSSQQIGNNDEQFVPPQMPPGAGTAGSKFFFSLKIL